MTDQYTLALMIAAATVGALIPMIIAASANGWSAVGRVIVVYEIATIAAIVVLVRLAHAGARRLRFAWIDRYGDAVAGGLMLSVGVLVIVVGI